MRIDAHQHFWRLDRGDYAWLSKTDHPKLLRDFLPLHLSPLLAAGRIDKTVLVQAAPSDAETRFLFDLAGSTPFVAGVVGWVDFEAEDVAAGIARLCAHPKLVGLRPTIGDLAGEEWLLRPERGEAVAAMQRGDLCFDALVKPRHLPALAEFLERYPDLAVVIDHAAQPDIGHAGLDMWASYIRHIARSTKACCKLSGLAFWPTPALRLYVDVLLQSFGPERLMWGSDWPVLNQAGDYASWLAACETLTRPLSAADRAQIFGGTAAKFYGLT